MVAAAQLNDDDGGTLVGSMEDEVGYWLVVMGIDNGFTWKEVGIPNKGPVQWDVETKANDEDNVYAVAAGARNAEGMDVVGRLGGVVEGSASRIFML